MEQRKIEYTIVDIDSIKAHPKNARQGDIGAISESLKAHGQYRPIVVDKRTNLILAGNHTWSAAKSLGWSEIAVGFIETKNDNDALRILLADNKSNDLASYDESGLIDLLKQLVTTDEGLIGTLFDNDELDQLIQDSTHFELPTDKSKEEVEDALDDNPTRLDINYSEWIKLGFDNGFCGPPVCEMHDGIPHTAKEDEQVNDGLDPCINVLRLYDEPNLKAEVEDFHSSSTINATNQGWTL